MENEELAALRATLLAAQRQPLAIKAAQARLRDRVFARDEMFQLRVLEGGADLPRLGSAVRRRAVVETHEPMPARPSRMAALLACLIVLCLVGQMLGMLFVNLR